MKSKKALSLVLCICMMVSLLSGCGGGQSASIQVQGGPDVSAVSQGEDSESVKLPEEEAQDEIMLADEKEINYEVNFVTGAEAKPAKTGEADSNKPARETTDSVFADAAAENTELQQGTVQDAETDPLLSVIEKNQADKEAEKNEGVSSGNGQDSSAGDPEKPFDQENPDAFEEGLVEYADNTLMVKLKKNPSAKTLEALKEAGVGKLEVIFDLEEYTWYTAYLLKETDINACLEEIRTIGGVETAEYNFKYEAAAATKEEMISEAEEAVLQNGQYSDQWYMKDFGIREGWYTGKTDAGVGGNTIVAVIDTGVDYNHIDLKANMWVNTGEIKDNGIDDDGDGYVDDYYGVDITAKRGSAMDDNGHGTHVAGIIGATNNKEGIVGLAYDAKIMAIKAGDASGYFLQSNVAAAIIYAYEHGADVINMSFGGSASSIAVQDALALAYNRCVLVASAGNNGAPNELINNILPQPNYPAAFSYVLGVMSVGSTKVESPFTNWDASAYNSVEYEVYAPGEQILSTLPGDRYAKLSGTSMAAPVVAAQAAVLRSMYPDRNTYPTKYIYGQIAGTSEDAVRCCDPEVHGGHNIPGVINWYESMTRMPVPELGMSDYTLFDTETFTADTEGIAAGSEEVNNGDGIVDAGEIIALGMTLKNRWGMSKNTTIRLDAESDLGVTNPYVEFLNNDINYGSVGTYSENDSGKVYSEDGDLWTGWENPFYIKIADNIPNDYTIRINVSITCENGLDESDGTVYTAGSTILLKVRRGVILPNKVTEDMTLTKDNYYIIPNSMIIMEGATVTVEPGTQIQFWCSDPSDAYADSAITYLQVNGAFHCNGTEEEPIEIFPSGWMDNYEVYIYGYSASTDIRLKYTNITNPRLDGVDEASNCEFKQNYKKRLYYRYLSNGSVIDGDRRGFAYIFQATDCVFYKLGGQGKDEFYSLELRGNYERCIFIDSKIDYSNITSAQNCVFYGNNNYWGDTSGGTSSLTLPFGISKINAEYIVRDNEVGKTYMNITGIGTDKKDVLNRFLRFAGLDLAVFHNPDNFNRVFTKLHDSYYCGIYEDDGTLYNHDGTKLYIDYELYKVTSTSLYPYNGSGMLYIGTPASSISNILVEVPGENYVTNIALKDYLVNLGMDETYQIQASLIPITASTDNLVYESMNTDVVTVDENGLVTPVAPGTAQVKVYSEDYAVFNYVTINVKEVIPLEEIRVSTDSMQMKLGESEKLQLTFVPGNTTKKAVEYSSSNTDAVIVNDAGVATAVGAGSAVITISGEGGITASMEIVVQVPAESVSFAEDMYVTNLEKEDGTDFYPIILPEEATNKELIWESSNPEICYVDEEGKLVKVTVGTSQLKATLAGTNLSDVITVAVTDAKVDVHIKKMQKNDHCGTFALTYDGTLWVWGQYINYPKKINLEYVRDFTVGGRYGTELFVLNEAGEVYQYDLTSSGELQGEKTKIMGNIDSFAAITSDSNATYIAIDKEGTAWAWGYNGCRQIANSTDNYINSPTQLNTEERIIKAVATPYRVVLLSDTGNAYISKNGMFEIAGENVIDIYSLDPNYEISVDFGDSADVYKLDWNPSHRTKTRNDMKVGYSVAGHYIEDGKVFIDKQIDGIENAADVFSFGNTKYIQTQDGKLYGYGSGSNNAFGNGSSDNADTPIRMYFGLQENTNGLSIRTSNFAEVNDEEHRILTDSGMELQFTQALMDSGNYPYITLKDSSGTSLSFVKTMDLNRLMIQPKRALEEGELYTLTIPAGAFTDRAGDSNEEIIIKFHYRKSAAATVKKMMEYDSGSGTFKLSLLQDGSLWIWGENQKSVFATPTILLQAGVSDFVVGSYGDLYVLRNQQVEKYTVDLDDFVNGLTADPTFALEDSTIVSLSSEQRNSGLCYAIAEDGSVYGWQNRSSEEPVKITLPAAVEKVVSTTSGAGFYTVDGVVYATANLQNTPVLIVENAADLYAAEDDSDLYIVQADTFVRWNIAEGEGEALTRNNEETIGSHCFYISGGRVHFRNNNGGWFTNTEYGDGDSPAVTCVSDVFDFGSNVYIQTAYGTVYAIGSGENYALGQGNKDSSAAPVPLHFDGADSDAAETAAVKKMMTRSTDGAKERYALRADGSLLMWGGSHSTPEMLFENSVQDFILYENQLYVLDDSGRVKRYTASGGDFVYTMQEDETFTPMTGIRALSSEKESTGTFFAVDNSGSVYGWGRNDRGQLGTGEAGEPVAEPTEVPAGTKIRKVICTEDGVAFLTETGRLIVRSFAAEGLAADATNSFAYNSVSDIYEGETPQYLYLKRGEDTVRWDFSTGSGETVYIRFDGESIMLGDHEISMEDGVVTLSGRSDSSFFEDVEDGEGIILTVESGAVKVFDFGDNIYLCAGNGDLYSVGIGQYNCLGTGTTEDSREPLKVEVKRPGDYQNATQTDEEKLLLRHYLTVEELLAKWQDFVDKGLNTRFYSNVILNRVNDDNVETWLRIQAPSGSADTVIGFGGNYWGTTNKDLINKQILDFDDFQNLADINEGEILTEAPEDTFPFVVDAYLELGGDGVEGGERVDTVGNDLVTFVVEFNRNMDTTIPLTVRFGSSYPYADYEVAGEYVSPRVWKGTMQLTTIIENGYQYWSVSNGKAAGTSLKLYTDWGRFPFKIDTTAAQALTMQAEPTTTGIQLTWTQDDFDTLAGYNVYRATSEDGQYTRINTTVIPADTKEWFDDTVEPGMRYYYNFTVVQTDFTESEPSGKVVVTAMDTMAPNIYHSPVYHAFTGSNLVISATVTDNVGITAATLYYRTVGSETWKTAEMTSYNDKYSAIIPAADLTLDGLEYYIDATDGISHTLKGSAEEPYVIIVQTAISDSDKGDVDGNGVIELKDAMMLLMAVNDRLNLTEEEFARADLNGNGELSASEALRILQYINGTITSVLQ